MGLWFNIRINEQDDGAASIPPVTPPSLPLDDGFLYLLDDDVL